MLPADFVLPVGRVIDLPRDFAGPRGHIDHAGSPRSMRGTAPVAATGAQEAANLVEMFGKGRSFRPQAPVLLWGADNRTPILIMTEGDVEVSELQDLAEEAIGMQAERVAATGRGLDYDALREKHGNVRRDKVPQAISDAIQERIAHHKQNPVTDPFRQPARPLGNVFAGVDVPNGEPA